MADCSVLEIVLGTYEKYLLGYKLIVQENQEKTFKLKPSFSNEAHTQSVRCIASSDKLLASGSIDESIQLFSMKTRQEIGSLLHHNGTITSLEFYESFLISSSEDGSICIWSVNNWQCMKTLRGHSKAVNHVSIHPSGKIALSVSNDKCLRTWNLINGRSLYATKLEGVADMVYWSPNGEVFLVVHHRKINVYTLKEASIHCTVDFNNRVCAAAFISDQLFVVGGENEELHVYNVQAGDLLNTLKTYSNRTKALKCVTLNSEPFLITASSDGLLNVLHLKITAAKVKANSVAKVNTRSRPTCMTVLHHS